MNRIVNESTNYHNTAMIACYCNGTGRQIKLLTFPMSYSDARVEFALKLKDFSSINYTLYVAIKVFNEKI